MAIKSTSSEMPMDPSTGQCYHTGCAKGDINKYILLCGDPDRANRVASRFDHNSLGCIRQHREYRTISGKYKGIPLTVTATGIGCDNTDICVQEHTAIVENPTFIRIGSCGSPRLNVNIGDLVISSRAIPHENTIRNYLGVPREPSATPVVLEALIQASILLSHTTHVGATVTTSSFYGGQGRATPGFPLTKKQEEFVQSVVKSGAMNIEMEMSTLFGLANCYRSAKTPKDTIRVGGVCAVYAVRNGDHKRFADANERLAAEARCIETGLLAIELLAAVDGKKP